MGLTYYYRFSAPADAPPAQLEKFLRTVETEAKNIGFKSANVLNLMFDTSELKQFARRLTSGYPIEDERLKGVTLLNEEFVWDYTLESGRCRLIPEKAVILVVSDETGCETCFGFLGYPKELRNLSGRLLLKTPVADRWFFEDWVKTPDPKFRKIVKLFADAGFVESERDDYSKK